FGAPSGPKSRDPLGCPLALDLGLDHNVGNWPLLPLAVVQADHGCLQDLGVGHDGSLELDGADPLAARLDHVLGSVDDRDVAVRAHRRHVAGPEPAVLGDLAGVGVVVIAACNPGTTALDLTESDSIPGQLLACGQVCNADLNARSRHTLLEADVQHLILRDPAPHHAHAADWGGLRHAPRVPHGQPDLTHAFHE